MTIRRLDPWTLRSAAWLRLAPVSGLRSVQARPQPARAAVRCEHCGGAVCVNNGTLICTKCGRLA